MASIERKRKGVYSVRWRDPDGRQRQRTVATRQAADDLRREVREAIDLGQRWRPVGARRAPELRTLFAAFLTAQVRLRARTLRRYGQMLEAFATWTEAQHGKRDATSELLGRSLLRDYFAHLTTTPGRNGAPRTVSTARKHVEAVALAWAWAWDEDEEHAWIGLIPRFRPVKLATVERAPTVAPTWPQMDAAIDACTTAWHRQLAVVLRCTGMRVSAALQLEWADLDLDAGTLTIRSETTKGGYSGRAVPLSPVLISELASWGRREGAVIDAPEAERRAARGDLGPSGKPARGRAARMLAAAWRRSGVPERVWKRQPGKAFRKGFTSELKRSGADVEAVERLVGHMRRDVRSHYLDDSVLRPHLSAAVSLVPGFAAVADLDARREKR